MGPPELVVEQYLRHVEEEARVSRELRGIGNPTTGNLKLGENRYGTLEAEIDEVRIQSCNGPTSSITTGDALQVEIDYSVHDRNLVGIFGVSISDAKGQTVVDLLMRDERPIMGTDGDRGSLTLHIERLDLGAGHYSINVGIFSPDFQETYDYHWDNYPLEVSGPAAGHGCLVPPRRWIRG